MYMKKEKANGYIPKGPFAVNSIASPGGVRSSGQKQPQARSQFLPSAALWPQAGERGHTYSSLPFPAQSQATGPPVGIAKLDAEFCMNSVPYLTG